MNKYNTKYLTELQTFIEDLVFKFFKNRKNLHSQKQFLTFLREYFTKHYSKATDVFQLGGVMHIILEFYERTAKNSNIYRGIKEVANNCYHFNANERYNIAKVISELQKIDRFSPPTTIKTTSAGAKHKKK